jgi:hypothetical protein
MMKKSACQINIDQLGVWERFYGKNLAKSSVPNCPECTAREKKKITVKYEEETAEEDRGRDDLFKLFDEIEIPMKMDPARKGNFICKRCGLYATREQVSDIRYKLNQREKTREDKHDDYLDWWSKSKKEKAEL